MNRCTHLFAMRPPAWRIALISTLLGLSLSASAQQSVRPFPANALRGTLQVTNPPEVLLDGNAARLSPGARIRGVNNLLVMSGAIVGQSLVVNYVRDPQGLVHEVWVLNATEAEQRMPGAQPQRNYASETYAPTAAGSNTTATTATPQQ
ncbi:MAG: hypothetical protein HYX43_20295 [Burkholderiales bacterium]|nr:hypothetical protein [Burkholderiales bacterium]